MAAASIATNQLYYGDNLEILRNHIPSESVDLIYIDPPFNSNQAYNVIFSNRMAPHLKRRSKPLRTHATGGTPLKKHITISSKPHHNSWLRQSRVFADSSHRRT